MNVKDRVIKVITEYAWVGVGVVKEGVSLSDHLNLDSLDITELAMAMEDEFNIQIPDVAAEKFITVDDITKYIEKEIKE